ncbi:hypothetical protein GCM10011611_63850 [Aliidongia dinghuensis]|uniref:Uncharacterized protein n=1 Tax=Aliidongia dinghuensis TaxID=1867774 RepID=A0A8J2Z0X7_9PROT|nr:hypothetical protein [Aliidongia dinghuensis]GGF48677.1 hypothetical protein GCM10011611_63850 [Aliidongia dinghuensis]
MAHAAPGSEVGKIAAYANAINAVNTARTVAERDQAITNAAAALAAASNKGISTTTVNAVNDRLGISVAPAAAIAIAGQASAIQTGR